MLSVENHPSDSHLKTADDDDDDKIKLTSSSQIEVVVDLFNSDFDDNHSKNNNNNPSPKFSIRDYVFSARNQNIATNWPFSEKNLQKCRKHGVTTLLPPFQPVDLVRFPSVNTCFVYNILPDRTNHNNPDGKTTSQNFQCEPVSADAATCNQKLNSDQLHITSSVSDQEEREVPSEVEQSHSEEDSVAAILLEPSTKQIEEVIPSPVICNTDKIIQPEPPVKKSRLVVKLGTLAGPSIKEDNMINNYTVSEIMASKVCPVCKIFSSSSNTTLNAHIDQCLSGVSTMKWTSDSKGIKHRIKPRKTRLMGDIYATAQHCTLEDLDRRNGTNWATNSTPPDQSNELCVEERVERLPSAGIEETCQKEGEVYIDTNGTKVRILSKFSEAANEEQNLRAQNILKRSKFLAEKKKKKHHLQKHQKFLKLVSHGKPFSSKPHPSFETRSDPSRNLGVGQSCEKEVKLGQPSKAQEQIKLDDSGIIKQWVGSKRTCLTKKTALQEKHQPSRHNLKVSVGGRDRSSLAKSYAGSNCLLNKQQTFKNLVSSQSSKKMETSKNEPSIGLFREQPLKRKREEFPWSSEGVGYRKRSMILPKHKKLRKEGTFVHDSCIASPNQAATGASSLSNKAAPTKTSKAFVGTSTSSLSHQAFSSKAMKFTSTRAKMTNQAIVPKFRSDVKSKSAVPTRSQANRELEINNNFAKRPSQDDDDQQLDSTEDFTNERSAMEENSVKTSRSRTRVLRIRNNRGSNKFSRKEEGADGLKNSPSEPCDYGHGVGETKEFSPVNFYSALEDSEDSFDDEESESEETLDFGENISDEPASKVEIGGFITFSNSIDSEFRDQHSSPEKRKSEQCAEVNQWDSCGHPKSPTDPSAGDKQEFFSAAEVGDVLIGKDTHMGAELDSKDEKINYFSEADPIHIPGPPGSFLPNLGHMGSDGLQGNSSSTCRVQSTEDQHDLVDRNKSDSPISAISDISNPTLAISESRSSKNFAVEPLTAQDEIQRGFSGAAQVSQAADLGAEQLNLDTSRMNVIFPEKAPVSSKFEPLCCCSRKEGAQGVALNFQESQLLTRQTMLSVPFPVIEMDNDCSERFSNSNSRSETFSLSNHPNSRPGTVVYPTRKFALEHIDKNVSAEHEVKFSSHRDLDSASPSASNSVLRLMGKNLMVVNKDEVQSVQSRLHQSSSMNSHPHLQSSTVSGISPSCIGNKDYHSYYHVAQSPIVFSQDRRQDAIGQQFDAKLPCNFEGYVDEKTPLTPFHAPGVKFPSMNAAGAFKAPLRQHEYKGGMNTLSEERRPKNRLDKPLTYGLEKNVATSGAKRWGVDSSNSREIIIIDDATDNESDLAIGTMCNDGIGRIRVSSSAKSIPAKFSSRFVTPYYSNPLEGACSLYNGQPVLHNASFQMPISEGINASPVKWKCNPKGPSFLHPGSIGAPSSSAGHLRPAVYYSPSFS